MPKRTAIVDLDEQFEVVCDITKTTVLADGRRVIRGCASGVAEDRDGERVSKNAIRKMAAQATAGGAIKLTSSHDQDWVSEFGEVTKLAYEADTDELLYEAELPAAGEDPVADKAWREVTSGRRLGVSIGGKLRKAFHELVDRDGRVVKRKVLDEIDLRHLMLTAKPSYRGAFAEAVAKTFTGDTPPDTDFTEDLEPDDLDVVKAAKPDDSEPPGNDGGQAPGNDGDADGPEPPAATGDTADEPTDAQDAQKLPEAKRHLSCPSCGHEFAAPMPKDAPEGDVTTDHEDDGDARKSHEEHPMDTIDETVEKLRTLAEDTADVTKTKEPAAAAATEPTPDEVAKAEADADDDVLKIVAASHRANSVAIDDLKANTEAGFGEVVKAIQGLAHDLASRPQGRKSAARVLPPAGEVEKTETETDDVAKAVEDAEGPLEALKALNAANGIR